MKDFTPIWSDFDSTSVPEEFRTTLWQQRTAEYLLPMKMQTRGQPIAGRIAGCSIGSAKFVHLRASAHTALRSVDPGGDSGSGYYKIALALRGAVIVRQHDEQICLQPGQLTVYDTSDGYEVGGRIAYEMLIAMIPHDAFGSASRWLSGLAARSIPSDHSRELKLALSLMLRDTREFDPGLDAIRSSARSIRPSAPGAKRDHDQLFRDSVSLIHRYLPDRRLSPDFLATRLGVSRRLLFQIFAVRIGPISAYIRGVRLDRARALLAEPSNDATPISLLAQECGFADPAHFSRLFRKEFDISPHAYRQGVRAQSR